MSCPNFHRTNARNFYVIYSSYKDDEDNEVQRDTWDWEDYFDMVRENISSLGYGKDNGYNNRTESSIIASSEDNWFRFGNEKCWPLETRVNKYLYVNEGYYSGANLDWDIEISSCMGDSFKLSDYDSLEDMLKDILDTYRDIIDWKGDQVNWNLGTFNIQKKNIEKWIISLINTASGELDNICKNNCEQEYYCAGIFSNGEAIYYKKVS